MKQSDFVFNFLSGILTELLGELPKSHIAWQDYFKPHQRQVLRSKLAEEIKSGRCPTKRNIANIELYASQLLSERLKKDPRMNGDKRYKSTSLKQYRDFPEFNHLGALEKVRRITANNPDASADLIREIDEAIAEAKIALDIRLMASKGDLEIADLPEALRSKLLWKTS